MELKGTQTINAARAQVWAALNDPAVLRQCIPGCESFRSDSDSTYAIVIMAAVGPVKAKFNGKLVLSDVRPEEGYTLSFEGSGGVAGFGKGGANVSLQTVETGTTLHYEVNARVGGKLAQVGARLIDGVAARMAEEFFSRFKAVVENADDPTGVESAQAAEAHPAAVPSGVATPDSVAVSQPAGANGPVVLAGVVDLRLSWPQHIAPPGVSNPPSVTALPILSLPSVVLLLVVAAVSYLLGRLG